MNQHINIEDYLEPTDPPLPLPAIETFKGTNTLDSTIEVGETMITQGYRIPLQIKQGATTKTADIYIGSSPLTQGQTITKSQSNVDLELFSGDNIIDTTLVNKPQVDLTYRSSVLGVGERTTNLLEITTESQTIGGVTFTVDRQAGTVTANGTATSVAIFRITFTMPAGNYYFSGCPMGGSNTTYDVFMYDNTAGARARKWNGTAASGYDYGGTDQEFKVIGGNTYAYSFRIYEGYVCDNLVLTPTVRVPGYQIPISVTNGQQSTPYNFYIGSAPLTEGQSISKTSTGTEIALYQGENTISTTLGNKPEMKIDYLSTVVGVGERTENLFDVNDYSVGELNFIAKRITLEPNTTYTMSSNCPRYNNGSLIVIGNVGESFTTVKNGVYPDHPISRTTDAKGELMIGLRSNGSDYTPADYESMLNLGSTPLPYEPYGYQIPIDIKQGDEVVDHKDIYIGTQTLVSGTSVNKDGAGVEIELNDGMNTITTDLYNEPEMYIK